MPDITLRSRRFIMPQPEAEEGVCGGEYPQPHKRREHIRRASFHIKQVKQRIILEQSQWNYICEKFQYPFTVDRVRITPELPSAMSQDVHEFQTFGSEKCKGRVYEIQAEKYYGTAGNHQNERYYFIPGPHDAAVGESIA